MITELLGTLASWPSLLLVILVFGFAPGFCLRLIVLAYPRDDPRRTELIAELYAVSHIWRPLWVAEQLEVALFEGLPHRWAAFLRWLTRQRSTKARNSNCRRPRRESFRGGSQLVFGLAGGLVGLFAGGLAYDPAYGPAYGLTGGLLVVGWLVGGFADGPAAGLTGGLVFGLASGLAAGFAGGLVFGLAGGLAYGFAGWLKRRHRQRRSRMSRPVRDP